MLRSRRLTGIHPARRPEKDFINSPEKDFINTPWSFCLCRSPAVWLLTCSDRQVHRWATLHQRWARFQGCQVTLYTLIYACWSRVHDQQPRNRLHKYHDVPELQFTEFINHQETWQETMRDEDRHATDTIRPIPAPPLSWGRRGRTSPYRFLLGCILWIISLRM